MYFVCSKPLQRTLFYAHIIFLDALCYCIRTSNFKHVQLHADDWKPWLSVLISFLAVALDVGEEIPHLGFKCQLLVHGGGACVWLVANVAHSW